ncbi:hypothetical protein [Photobacterium leiognathi]|uniref:hypothetical protein n=1 Tax=Photobacterium leiognathi TaxID=553611 RepID=UPI00273975B1|nr:hypothetical protein [Photobacterium leiognathi]
MCIQPCYVDRDEDGYWIHPELPNWDESTTSEVINAWFKANNCDYAIVYFESDAPEALSDKYYEQGEPGVGDWEPTLPHANAFLLSIHDAEDSPIALFAIPKDQ